MDTHPAIARSVERGIGGLRRLLPPAGTPRGWSRGRRRTPVPPDGRWVAAAVTDDLDAVEVARTARDLAGAGDGRLLLLVPQPAGGFTTEPMVSVMMQRRCEEAALAIAGRVLPVLEDSAAPLREIRTHVVPHGWVSWSGRRPDGDLGGGPAVRAVLSVARRAGAGVLVVPAAMLPGRTRDGRPLLVHVDDQRVVPTGDPSLVAPAVTASSSAGAEPPAPAAR